MTDLIGQTLGQYEIISLIGVGSTATVYQARPVGTASTVAIKVIETPLARDPEFVRRFGREAEAIAALSHPAILNVYGYGRERDWLYLVMALLPGGSLAQRIRERPLSGPRAARYLDQIASALDYAHGESIIHRDLRPQNVLFDRQGNAILTDFGISALLPGEPSAPSGGVILGAPAYMAPEQWQSRDVDGRADLYALGVMVYEMLAGQTPFGGDSPGELMRAHLSQPPPSIRAIRPDLPESVEVVLEKALAKARDVRFQSGAAFGEAFRTALSGRIPGWLDVGAPPGNTGASVGIPPRRAVRRSARRAAANPAETMHPMPKNRRLGLLTIGLLAVIGMAAIVGLLLTSRGTNGPNVPPTTTLQLAVAPSITFTPVIGATATRVNATNTAVLAPSGTPRPSLTPTLTPSAAPSETHTPDIPATVAHIVAMTDTAAATLASPTLTATVSHTARPTLTETPSFTPSATPTHTITPDIPATVAHIVGQTNTAVALAASPTPTTTPSFTPSATWTATFTATPSQTASLTRTATPSFTPSATPTDTITPDIPATVAHIVAMTDTAAATLVPPTPTITPSLTPSATWTTTVTLTPSQTASPTRSATPSFTPSATPTGTITPDIPATVAHIIAMTDTAAATLATPTPTLTPSFTPSRVNRATLTPTPTATATSTLDIGVRAVTNAPFANLRAGPGTSFVRLSIATLGQSFPVIGRTAQGNWLQVILPDGRAAWVSAGLVQVRPQDVTIPVITVVPPTPTETPTETPAS